MKYLDEEIILDYLENNLSPNDAQSFKEELLRNHELQIKVEEYKDALMAIKIAGRKELSKKLHPSVITIKTN